MNRSKALVVGIDNYPNPKNKLTSSINDANTIAALLERNFDESKNFNVMKLLDKEATRENVLDFLNKVFDEETETGVFYFSGHGFDNKEDGQIVTYDFDDKNLGVKFKEINEIVRNSKCKNKVIILDCCFSGKVGNYQVIGDTSILSKGTTILTSCNEREVSYEGKENSVFTELLIYALNGGSSDIFGRVTPASIYSYIDSCLGAFEQRPLFKSYVSSFVTLRQAEPKIEMKEMKKIAKLFKCPTEKYQLDPSYEPTNFIGSKGIGKKDLKEPYCTHKHTEIFALLQKAAQNGLIRPTKEKHMFYAAINSDTCELTKLGIQYWMLVDKDII